MVFPFASGLRLLSALLALRLPAALPLPVVAAVGVLAPARVLPCLVPLLFRRVRGGYAGTPQPCGVSASCSVGVTLVRGSKFVLPPVMEESMKCPFAEGFDGLVRNVSPRWRPGQRIGVLIFAVPFVLAITGFLIARERVRD